MPRFTSETALVAVELQQIVAEFANDLDFNDGLNIYDFYTADGEFAVGDFAYKGHDAIRKFYTDRKERMLPQLKDGIRVAAHTFLNVRVAVAGKRSEEHTSELQSLMRTSYAVFCSTNTNR